MSSRALTEIEDIIRASPQTDCENAVQELAAKIYQRIAENYNIDEWNRIRPIDLQNEIQIDNDFVNTMIGNIDEIHPLRNSFLRHAYDSAKASGLNETLRLKYCCVILSKIIDDNIMG